MNPLMSYSMGPRGNLSYYSNGGPQLPPHMRQAQMHGCMRNSQANPGGMGASNDFGTNTIITVEENVPFDPKTCMPAYPQYGQMTPGCPSSQSGAIYEGPSQPVFPTMEEYTDFYQPPMPTGPY